MFDFANIAGGALVGALFTWILIHWVKVFVKEVYALAPENSAKFSLESKSRNIPELVIIVLMTIAAGVIGYFAERNYNESYFKSLISLTAGTFIIFLLGVGYLGSVIGYDKALTGGLYPFIPSEFFKIGLAVVIIPSITKYINK